jgi:glutamyl-tRNA reductase
MNVVVLGLNHRSAGVEIRERFAVEEPVLKSALHRFRSVEGVHEAVILSTCNRVEFYAAGPGLASGFDGFEHFLVEHSGLPNDVLEAVYRYDFPHSAAHLFRVVCGLDSMVLGETEILGQVKKSYAAAIEAGMTSRVLNRLFQHSFRVAKQVRARTSINRGSISIGSVAADLAERICGELSRCEVLILGAGETAERAARSLVSRGTKSIRVANRSADRGLALAESLQASTVDFSEWRNELHKVDILVSCTASPEPLVRAADLRAVIKKRDVRPLFIIDLAVPRDVEASVNELENVFLYDIDSLEKIAQQSLEERERERTRCEEMIHGHVQEFAAWMRKEQNRLGPQDSACSTARPGLNASR